MEEALVTVSLVLLPFAVLFFVVLLFNGIQASWRLYQEVVQKAQNEKTNLLEEIRVRDEAIKSLQKEAASRIADEASEATVTLRTKQIPLTPSITAFTAFQALADNLAIRIDDWQIKGLLKEKLPDACDWNAVQGDTVISPMILAGVVDSHDRPEPPASDFYIPTRSFVKVYKLTDLGKRVTNKLVDEVFNP
jgi:hypothetical protein